MIPLLLAMLRARRVQAFTVFLLSALSTAAAVAGPVALRTVEVAVIRHEVAAASTREKSISLYEFSDSANSSASDAFDSIASLIKLPGFQAVRAGEIVVFDPAPTGAQRANDVTHRVVFRDAACAHVLVVAGRCYASALEVIIGEQMATRVGLHPGDTADIQAARYDARLSRMVPDGPPATVLVAGTYRPRDPEELFWGAEDYFPVSGQGGMEEPVLVSPQGIDLIPHTSATSTDDLLATDTTFTPDGLDALKTAVLGDIDPNSDWGLPPGVTVSSEIPGLLDRIRHGREVAGTLVPVAFVPLVAMCWFVIFLAVAYGLAARREEIGLVKLRGTSPARRWCLALGEPTVCVVLGAPVGYLLGYAVVAALAKVRLGDADGAQLDTSALPYAAWGLAGALLVAFVGQRRSVAEPVVDLLRGVPKSAGVWRSLAFEATVVALAALGVIQLTAGSGLTGVALLVPGLVVIAVGLLAARLFAATAGLVAAHALNRGRLGSGLAAIQIARRPGSHQLFTLVAVALGMLCFVASAAGVAGVARQARAEVLVGAPVVLTADPVGLGQLLHATRAADREGRWAMAVQPIDQRDPTAPPVLAVDSSRLAAVARWRPEFGLSPTAIADLLRPPPAHPMVLAATSFTLQVERDPAESGQDPAPLTVKVHLESLKDGTDLISVIEVGTGRASYIGAAPACPAGCRLAGFEVVNPAIGAFRFAVLGMRAGPTVAGPQVIPAADLDNPARWNASINSTAAASGGALHVSSNGDRFSSAPTIVAAVDIAKTLPVISTEPAAGAISPSTQFLVDTRVVGGVALLPRVGSRGTLVDLEAVQRVALSGPPRAGEVWLGPAAPPDAIDRLRAQGLAVSPGPTIAQTRTALDGSGPAMALQFHLGAAGLGVLLALGGMWLVAAVDRRRRARDLQALRLQGLPRRFARRAALWGYLCLVIGSAVAGLAAGAAAWFLTGTHLPVFPDSLPQLHPPAWPDPIIVVRPWSVAAAGMILAAVVAAYALHAAVRARTGRG